MNACQAWIFGNVQALGTYASLTYASLGTSGINPVAIMLLGRQAYTLGIAKA